MRIITVLMSIFLLWACKEVPKMALANTNDFRLTMPQISASNLLFHQKTNVSIRNSLDGATIKYTIDGSPVTKESVSYAKPIVLNESATIAAQTFHPDYQESSITMLQVRKVKEDIGSADISLVPKPHEKYKASGAKSLTDLKKGTLQFTDGQWLGFQTKSVVINLNFSEARKVSKVILSSLLNHGSWIFLPEEIEIISENKQVGKLQLNTPTESEVSAMHYIEILIAPKNYHDLEIKISPLNKIPNWHPGQGTGAWFFIDEILIE